MLLKRAIQRFVPIRLPLTSILVLSLLIAVGCAATYYNINLFFGVDLIFGNVFALLILYLFGPFWGMVAAVVINSMTWPLWGHPYATLIFSMEVFFISLFLQRARGNMLILDGIYWAFIGGPLVCYFYTGPLSVDFSLTLLITLKDAANGLLNVLLVSLAVLVLPYHKWMNPTSKVKPSISLYQVLFNVLIGFVLLSSLLVSMVNNKQVLQKISDEIRDNLSDASQEISLRLGDWQSHNLQAVNYLAQVAAHTYDSSRGLRPTETLQSETDLLLNLFDVFHCFTVMNLEGEVVAFSTSASNGHSPMEKVDVGASPVLQTVQDQLQPVLSDVYISELSGSQPVIAFAVPVQVKGELVGMVLGEVNLNTISRYLTSSANDGEVYATVVDGADTVMSSTHLLQRVAEPYDAALGESLFSLSEGVYHRMPKYSKDPLMLRWRDSSFLKEVPFGKGGEWRVVVEVPLSNQYHYLERVYLQSFSILLFLVVLAMFFSALFSLWVSRLLSRLAAVSNNLPSRLVGDETIEWPASATTEISSLIGNFKKMAQEIKQNVKEMERDKEELLKLTTQLAEANQLLQRLSTQDELTGLANRRRFDEYLVQEWNRSVREGSSLALIILDIDYFKDYNDTYGHQAGDECLVRVAKTLSQALKRPGDLAVRYGGEEFVLVLPHTDAQGAAVVAEDMRGQVEALKLEHADSRVSPYVTVSFGVASCLPGRDDAAEALIAAADHALYQAKQQGRNRVCVAGEK